MGRWDFAADGMRGKRSVQTGPFAASLLMQPQDERPGEQILPRRPMPGDGPAGAAGQAAELEPLQPQPGEHGLHDAEQLSFMGEQGLIEPMGLNFQDGQASPEQAAGHAAAEQTAPGLIPGQGMGGVDLPVDAFAVDQARHGPVMADDARAAQAAMQEGQAAGLAMGRGQLRRRLPEKGQPQVQGHPFAERQFEHDAHGALLLPDGLETPARRRRGPPFATRPISVPSQGGLERPRPESALDQRRLLLQSIHLPEYTVRGGNEGDAGGRRAAVRDLAP